MVNQTKEPPIERAFISIGRFRFDEGTPAKVNVSNEGTDGYVIVDAVRFLESVER